MSRNEQVTSIGLRMVRAAVRSTEDGLFDIPATVTAPAAYAGVQLSGAMGLTLNVPEPTRVTARGDDRAYHTFSLPPGEQPTGELRVSKANFPALALLTSTKMFGSPTVRKVGVATDKQGDETPVILWGSHEAIDSEEGSAYFGASVWRTYLLLNAIPTVRPSGAEDQTVAEMVYSLVMNNSSIDELGRSFTTETHGFTKAPVLMIVTIDKFWLDAFEGTGADDEFTLTWAGYVTENDGILVTVDGVPTAFTETDGVITITGGAPADGAKIMVEYTYSD